MIDRKKLIEPYPNTFFHLQVEDVGRQLYLFLIFFAYFFVSRQKSEVGFGATPQGYRRL